MTQFWIDLDGDDEPTLWTGDRETPTAVIRRCDLPTAVRDNTWMLLHAASELAWPFVVERAADAIVRRAQEART